MDWLVYSDRHGWLTDNYMTVARTRFMAEILCTAYPNAHIHNKRTGTTYARSGGVWRKA